MNHTPLVIKLGGAVLSDLETLQQLFNAIDTYQQQEQRPMLIVHGGGYLVDDLMAKCNLEVVKKSGLRVTPKDQAPLIAGALAGTANKLLLGEAMKSNLQGVGLCLGDGNMCKVTQLDPELGSVGLASAGDASLLKQLLSANFLPIISSIGLDADGELMNVNADQAAVAVATTLNAEVVLLSDVAGVLDENKELISEIDQELSNKLIADGVISDGMIVKVQAAFEAAQELGRPISIASWRSPKNLVKLFAGENIGTIFNI